MVAVSLKKTKQTEHQSDTHQTEQTAPNGDSLWSRSPAPYFGLCGPESSGTDAGDNIFLEDDYAPQTVSVSTLEQHEITFTKSPVDSSPQNNVQIQHTRTNINYTLIKCT